MSETVRSSHKDRGSQPTESTIYVVQAGDENIHFMVRNEHSERIQYDKAGRIIKIGDEIIRYAEPSVKMQSPSELENQREEKR